MNMEIPLPKTARLLAGGAGSFQGKGCLTMRTNEYRTHISTAVTEEAIGQNVRVAGWVENIRDHGGVKFLDIRDHYGVVQAV